jgi:phosphate transport system permease protein
VSNSIIFLSVLLIGVAAYLAVRIRAGRIARASGQKLHSLPGYYGAYGFVSAVLPAIFVFAVWSILSPALIDRAIYKTFPPEVVAQSPSQQTLAMGMIQSVARGIRLLDDNERAQATQNFDQLRPALAAKGVALASDSQQYMITSAQRVIELEDKSRFAVTLLAIGVALAGAAMALVSVNQRLRARNRVETVILGALILSSSIAILTTVGIVLSLVFDTARFFASVPPHTFFFGTVWDPRFSAAGSGGAEGQFGLIPLLAGTLYIAFVAMLFAVPVGLFSAMYMAEYASPRFRALAKPLLEVLAGIPTIVYGFFALVTVGPMLRDISGELNNLVTGNPQSFIQAQSVLTAGLVMGIMLIPFVSSLSDDIITQVPRAMRDGSLGLGATRSETMRRVILPSALPGIVGALLLTASRAIGETMIVVLAAGVAARLDINPFEPMTTVTVKIVSQLTGDLEFNSPQTLVAFALGLTLFVLTLILNIYALYIVRKYREQYE